MGVEAEDIANDWVLNKARYLKDTDDPDCWFWSFDYQVFLGVKRWAQGVYESSCKARAGLLPTSTVSLDADHVPEVADDCRFSEVPCEDAETEELLASLEAHTFGDPADGLADTAVGPRRRDLRSVAELLMLGYKKSEIAEMFDVSKSFVTTLTRYRLAAALNAEA